MFKNLGGQLSRVFDSLTNRGLLTEKDVDAALREIRLALLEADVALPVAKEFIAVVREKAIGTDVLQSIKPGQMVVKIVHDHLIEILGGATNEINLSVAPPAVIMVTGLQGSGKTTTTAKLAKWLHEKQNKKVLMVSVDIYRPAAQQQLEILGQQIGVDTVEIIANEKPEQIVKRALAQAKQQLYDILLVDTAGRLHIDEELMNELINLHRYLNPIETFLVADSLTGQDAVNIAKAFKEALPLTGIILTRIDGDNRGGAALSMRTITGCPIKFVGVGEKVDEFQPFHPDRIASRILDMGDIVSLVESAAQNVDMKSAENLAKRMQKGIFDLDDLAAQMKQLNKMGGIGTLLGMLPGMGKIQQQIKDANINDKHVKRQEAIISSMTKKERKNPDLLNGSRKRRVAAGAGVTVQEVNQLLKRFKDMKTMMQRLGKMDKKSLLRSGLGNLLPNIKP